MPTPWTQHPIHVVDFEGSGQYGIIEYGIAVLHHGQIECCHSGICEAEEAIDARDTWKHGLKREDTIGQPPFKEHWELFNSLRQHGPFAAHQASVENRLIKRVWPYPSTAPGFLPEGQLSTEWGPWIDTCVLYQATFPDLSKHKLGSLIESFNLQDRLEQLAGEFCPGRRCRYHCALYDALASALLLIHLAEQPGFEALSLDWLIEYSASPREVDTIRQGRLL